MFSDTLNGDFTLSENSPCIDAGTALYILNGDTILNFPTNTYDGLAPDMGFIESPYPLGINEGLNQPKKFILSQNYPNPFNPTTKIKFTIPSVGTSRYSGTVSVQLKVYDVLGNEVATLVNENKPAGSYEVEFDGTDLISGIYFYRIEAGSFIKTKKMILIK
ncbi:MAG: T9SS type A sorting domain-containing protein [Bacteroidetes bacterium]|nr:T9SS type A sorting domain-containing protein [Bacteroidota bacterium]